MRLVPGDQIQTGEKTSVELVMMPRRSRLRLSENTVVTIRDLGEDGSTGLELLYGRLRSKVVKMTSGDAPYRVSSQSFIAGVRGTDFGCDVLAARPGESASTRVYCFEGSVELKSAEAASVHEGDITKNETSFVPIIVNAGKMAVIEAPSAGKAAEVVQGAIDADTATFWKAHEFTAAQPVAAAVPAAESPAVVKEPVPAAQSAPQIDLRPIMKSLAVKNNLAVGGIVFVGMGIAMEGVSLLMRSSDPGSADRLLLAGSLTAALGLPVIVFSIAVNPLHGLGRIAVKSRP
jgi:hypothetical protein